MSNAARNQFGIQSEVLRNIDKHEKLPSHDLHVGQHVMYQDSVTEKWYPATIACLCQEKWSHNIKNSDGVFYWKNQAHFMPYTPNNKNAQSTQPMAQLDHKWPMVQLIAQPDHKKHLPVNSPTQVITSVPKRNTKTPFKLDL